MGYINVNTQSGSGQQRLYMKKVLEELRALDYMLKNGMFETDVQRIGAEQELVLVNKAWKPAPIALEILGRIDDPRVVNELALFNVEFNVEPLLFQGNCLSTLETHIRELLNQIREVAHQLAAEVVLVGILPTFVKSDLEMHNITPRPRYFELNEALKRLRGGAPIELYIKGIDELKVSHDSVMIESCNTSFQVHFQVNPDEFARYYNICQTIAGPVLAVATNSPILLGKRLWRESRIAVFQQAMDTRSRASFPRELKPRVHFGSQWVKESVVEIYQEDIGNYRTFFTVDIEENAFESIKKGTAPKLRALQLFNGSIYRWNRPCYGITDGKPHLRIENRCFPSGPTVVDEVANAAFWLGLVNGMANRVRDVTTQITFDEVQANFFAAAAFGLEAQFSWLKGKVYPARELILKRLLPIAREGLEKAGVDGSDIDRYLEIIRERTQCGKTGARWILDSYEVLREKGTLDEALSAITAAMNAREQQNMPVHTWPTARIDESGNWKGSYQRVEQVMSRDFYTVGPDEPVDLVASLMIWNRVRHIPVEDDHHRLIGLISYRSLIKLLLDSLSGEVDATLPASAIMVKNPTTVSPDIPILEAIELMREKGIGCLPVVNNERLVGLITEREFTIISRELLEQNLRED